MHSSRAHHPRPQPSVLDLADSALRPLDSAGDLRLAAPLMQQLRPHLEGEADFAARVQRQRLEGYQLIGAFTPDGSHPITLPPAVAATTFPSIAHQLLQACFASHRHPKSS